MLPRSEGSFRGETASLGGPHLVAVAGFTDFDQFPQLVDSAGAVVIATVEDIDPGRHVGDDPDALIGFDEVTLRIERVLSGTANSEQLTLEIEPEVGFRDALSDAWLNVGRRSLLFVVEKTSPIDTPGLWRLLNSHSVYLIEDSQDLVGMSEDQTDVFSQAVAERSLDEVVRLITSQE